MARKISFWFGMVFGTLLILGFTLFGSVAAWQTSNHANAHLVFGGVLVLRAMSVLTIAITSVVLPRLWYEFLLMVRKESI